MALEFGSGTQADPYLLATIDDVKELFIKHQASGKYFALINDIDASKSAIVHAYETAAVFHLDGRGYTLKVWLKSQYYGDVFFDQWGSGSLKDITFHVITNGNYTRIYIGMQFSLENAVVVFSRAATNNISSKLLKGSSSLIVGGNCAVAEGANIYKEGSPTANTINTASFADGNKFNKTNYPTLDERKWIFDGISLPRPRQQSTADLTTRFGVKGQTKVGGNNRQRNLAVFTKNGLRYKVQDTKADGSFFLNLNDVSTPVIVMAYDDIGAKAAINTAYSLNQIIHPAIPNGFRYRCTLAGNSGATIPSEPWSTTTVLTIGAAKFTPEPVYEPKAHGPLLPVLFNVVTEQPV